LETGKKADIHFVFSKELKEYQTGSGRSAGRQPQVIQKGETDGQTEGAQGRHTSARELYRAAKAFISLL
jgi:hypothetical protein